MDKILKAELNEKDSITINTKRNNKIKKRLKI